MSDTHLEIERTYDLPEGGALPDLVGAALLWTLVREPRAEAPAAEPSNA